MDLLSKSARSLARRSAAMVETLAVSAPAAGAHQAEAEGAEAVDSELQGMVLIMAGQVFDETLEPVADVASYEEAYENVGVDVPDTQIGLTLRTQPRPEAASDETVTGGFGFGIAGPVTMEAPGCSGHDQHRKLQTMTRVGKNRVVTKGVAYRMCGVPGSAGWGWRHIDTQHKKDWNNVAALFGRGWDDFAAWAIYGIVGSPSAITYQTKNSTYLYTAPIQLWKNGKYVTTYMPKVSIAKNTWRIVTAFPSR